MLWFHGRLKAWPLQFILALLSMSFDFYCTAETVVNVATCPTLDHRKGTWLIVILSFNPFCRI